MNWVKVDSMRFYEFINSYPLPLEKDVCGICEPPLISYNDFSNEKIWPESMVAKIKAYDGSAYHSGKTEEYYIKS
jgi:hypothetical protein